MRLSEYSVYQFQIEFEDVDMAGVAFHGNYLSYVMRARMHYLNEIDFTYQRMLSEGIAFLVVEANQKFLKPLFCSDKFYVHSKITEVTSKTLTVYQAISKTSNGQKTLPAENTISELTYESSIKLISVDTKTGRAVNMPNHMSALFKC
jgi:YbgC/YbaW family acyl-CoA thioester hydrolase